MSTRLTHYYPSRHEPLEENLRLYKDDIDLRRDWIGPRPNLDQPNKEIWNSIERVFTSANLIKQCVDRHASALVSKQPQHHLVDADGQAIDNAQAEDLTALLQRWLETSNAMPAIMQAVIDALVQEVGYLRIYEPKFIRGLPNPTKRIKVERIDPDAVTVEREGHLVTKLVYRYTAKDADQKDQTWTETQTLDQDTGRVTILIENKEGEEGEPFEVDYFGRMTIQEIKLDTIVTETARSNQRAIFLYLTMMVENTITAGWLERIVTNANIKDSVDLGAGQMMNLVGLQDADGKRATPSVIFREPATPDVFEKAYNLARLIMYEDFNQAHLLTISDGAISGRSRITVKQDFAASLAKQAPSIQQPLEDLLAVVMLRLGELTGRNYTMWEPVVKLMPNLGEPLPEEQDAAIATYNANLQSQGRAMRQIGVEDPEAEKEAIAAEREEAMENGINPNDSGVPPGTPRLAAVPNDDETGQPGTAAA